MAQDDLGLTEIVDHMQSAAQGYAYESESVERSLGSVRFEAYRNNISIWHGFFAGDRTLDDLLDTMNRSLEHAISISDARGMDLERYKPFGLLPETSLQVARQRAKEDLEKQARTQAYLMRSIAENAILRLAKDARYHPADPEKVITFKDNLQKYSESLNQFPGKKQTDMLSFLDRHPEYRMHLPDIRTDDPPRQGGADIFDLFMELQTMSPDLSAEDIYSKMDEALEKGDYPAQDRKMFRAFDEHNQLKLGLMADPDSFMKTYEGKSHMLLSAWHSLLTGTIGTNVTKDEFIGQIDLDYITFSLAEIADDISSLDPDDKEKEMARFRDFSTRLFPAIIRRAGIDESIDPSISSLYRKWDVDFQEPDKTTVDRLTQSMSPYMQGSLVEKILHKLGQAPSVRKESLGNIVRLAGSLDQKDPASIAKALYNIKLYESEISLLEAVPNFQKKNLVKKEISGINLYLDVLVDLAEVSEKDRRYFMPVDNSKVIEVLDSVHMMISSWDNTRTDERLPFLKGLDVTAVNSMQESLYKSVLNVNNLARYIMMESAPGQDSRLILDYDVEKVHTRLEDQHKSLYDKKIDQDHWQRSTFRTSMVNTLTDLIDSIAVLEGPLERTIISDYAKRIVAAAHRKNMIPTAAATALFKRSREMIKNTLDKDELEAYRIADFVRPKMKTPASLDIFEQYVAGLWHYPEMEGFDDIYMDDRGLTDGDRMIASLNSGRFKDEPRYSVLKGLYEMAKTYSEAKHVIDGGYENSTKLKEKLSDVLSETYQKTVEGFADITDPFMKHYHSTLLLHAFQDMEANGFIEDEETRSIARRIHNPLNAGTENNPLLIPRWGEKDDGEYRTVLIENSQLASAYAPIRNLAG